MKCCICINRINQYMYMFFLFNVNRQQYRYNYIQTANYKTDRSTKCYMPCHGRYVFKLHAHVYIQPRYMYLLISHRIYLVYQVVICSNRTGDTQHVDQYRRSDKKSPRSDKGLKLSLTNVCTSSRLGNDIPYWIFFACFSFKNCQ